MWEFTSCEAGIDFQPRQEPLGICWYGGMALELIVTDYRNTWFDQHRHRPRYALVFTACHYFQDPSTGLLQAQKNQWVSNLQLTTWICAWVAIIKAHLGCGCQCWIPVAWLKTSHMEPLWSCCSGVGKTSPKRCSCEHDKSVLIPRGTCKCTP